MPDFVMQKPRPGDLVLFSHDITNFSSPVIAWVQDDRGECAVNLLAFSLGGFVYKTSVHHKDDPALRDNPGWHEFGCWDYAPVTKQLHELTKQHGNQNAKPAGK
jgi:hypothetical protein